MASPFGSYVPVDRVEDAALATLWHWLPTYLSNIERDAALPIATLARPRRWKIIANWDELDIDGKSTGWPVLAVISPGPDPRSLTRNETGGWDGWFRLAVGVAVQSENRRYARVASSRILLAALMVMVDRYELRAAADGNGAWTWSAQHPPIAESIRIDSGPDLTQTPPADRRNRAACAVDLAVYIRNIVSASEGPEEPAGNDGTDPVDDWPTADSVDIDIRLPNVV